MLLFIFIALEVKFSKILTYSLIYLTFWDNWLSIYWRIKFDPDSVSYIKTFSKWVKSKIWTWKKNLSGGNTEGKCHDVGLSIEFLDMTWKKEAMKVKMDCSKWQSSAWLKKQQADWRETFTMEEPVNRVKRQSVIEKNYKTLVYWRANV